MLFVTTVVIVAAPTSVTTHGTATATINVGGVSGTVGHEGGKYYGFHCTGLTCTGSDTKSKSNQITVTLTREAGDTATYEVKARSDMSNKESGQTTQDNDCVQGPPTWVATGEVKMSDPQADASNPVYSNVRIAELFGHTQLPTTTWTKKWNQPGSATGGGTPGSAIGGYDGTNYGWNQSEEKTFPWAYDPNNPSTNSFIVRATVACSFTGQGVEIIVDKSYLKAKCFIDVRTSVQ